MSTHTDKEYYNLNISITKALNGVEAPLKTKHARSAIIMIHKTREAKSFWMIISRQPLMESRFTAWKFCHLLHKVLREAHECAIKQSQSHKKMILEMGKLWGHLHDDIGFCIKAYSQLLVTKLNFHDKYRMYPGSLNITIADIAKFADRDQNLYFQLCVDIFDYLDDIIDLQLAIFSSINTYRMSSMTQQGQCRLAPLICVILDSNALYDISVRLMFKLHDNLPSDVLEGHRSRFNGIFLKLKAFYENVRPLQYFADLIQVPQLPESSPNFRSQVDFGSYIPPVVFVQPEPEPEPIVNDLIDSSEQPNNMDQEALQRIASLESTILDKNEDLEQLSDKLEVLKNKYTSLENTYKRDIQELQRSQNSLLNDLALAKEMYTNLRLERDELELQVTNNPILIQKANEEEEKLKLSEEKFNKLKTMYSQIRDEHINLLRQQSDSSKSLNKQKQSNSELMLEVSTLNNNMSDLKTQIEELTKNNTTLQQQIEDQKEEYENLKVLQDDFKLTQAESLQKRDLETKDLQSTVELLKQTNSELLVEVDVLKNNSTESKKKIEELTENNSSLMQKIEEHKEEYQKLKTLQENLNLSQTEVLQKKDLETQDLQATLNLLKQTNSDLTAEVNSLKNDSIESKKQIEELTSNKNNLLQQIQNHKDEYQQFKTDQENLNLSQTEVLQKKDLESRELQSTISTLQEKLTKTEAQLNQAESTIKDKTEELQLNLSNYNQESQKLTTNIQEITQKYEKNLAEIESNLNNTTSSLEECKQAGIILKQEKESSIQQCSELQQQVVNLEEKLSTSIRENKELIDSSNNVMKLILETAKEFCSSKLNDSTKQPLDVIQKIISETEVLLNKVKFSSDEPLSNKIKDIICLSFVFSKLYDQCDLLYNSTTEIDKGVAIFNKVRSVCETLVKLYDIPINNGANSNVLENDMKTKLSELHKLIQDILDTYETEIDLNKLVEAELKEMDTAIEEAANKIIDLLSQAREKDNGIKLEVSEKILDACTNLMVCIKVLIQKSKILQQEIISSQRGNVTVKEFYKRNSQWSEGLISASKNVAKAANYLVDAANNAVVNESGNNFELIVAAQEIAACTAQLVIASKVKANRESTKLSDLTSASRNVSKATGTVVATVKDCNTRLEQANDTEITKLTPSQVKTMEMEIHVKVLELEQALQNQRFKLSAFRKEHYQNKEY